MGNIEATDAKIEALRDGLNEVKTDVRELRADLNSLRGEVKTDVRELRADLNSLRGEMHAGFAALRESGASIQASVAELRATMKTMFWAISSVGMLATIFFTAGKALHWF